MILLCIGKVEVIFSQPTYNVMESSNNLIVTLLLRKGISTDPINITVMTTDQSAKGKRCVYHVMTI